MAPAGQTWAQAVVNESVGTFVFAESRATWSWPILASSMRCTQNVHFSITPRMRTVTFGFLESFLISSIPFLPNGPRYAWLLPCQTAFITPLSMGSLLRSL